jgi:hypothetical protein
MVRRPHCPQIGSSKGSTVSLCRHARQYSDNLHLHLVTRKVYCSISILCFDCQCCARFTAQFLFCVSIDNVVQLCASSLIELFIIEQHARASEPLTISYCTPSLNFPATGECVVEFFMYINFLDMKKSHMQLKIVEFTSLGVVAPAPIQHAPSEQSPRKKARLAAAAAAAAASSEVAHAFVGAAGAAAAPTATSTPPTPVGAPLVRPPRY